MRALEAAKQTMRVWETRGRKNPHLPNELSYAHCQDMLLTMSNSDFSYGKLCRWLGWMQAACVANGASDLDEMKLINMACAK